MSNVEMMRQIGTGIALAMQKSELTDQEALQVKNLHNEWKAGEHVVAGDRRQYNDLLYKCRQEHTTQEDWTPDKTPALWEVIDEEHAGTQDDPIPYSTGMQLYNGKYYTESDILYLCNRDTGQAVYQSLADLVNIYVVVVEPEETEPKE